MSSRWTFIGSKVVKGYNDGNDSKGIFFDRSMWRFKYVKTFITVIDELTIVNTYDVSQIVSQYL